MNFEKKSIILVETCTKCKGSRLELFRGQPIACSECGGRGEKRDLMSWERLMEEVKKELDK